MKIESSCIILAVLSTIFQCACGTAKMAEQQKPEINSMLHKTNTKIVENNASTAADDGFFEALFKKYPGKFDDIIKNKKQWNVQIIYTQINRDKNGNANLTSFYYNKNNRRYYYPASTVKFPVALLALQKINELKIKGLDKNSSMLTQASYSGQTEVYNDPNTANGKPSIASYIKKIFLVSDNDAFNRLYEFLGQEYINSQLHKKGYTDAQILHRLSTALTEDENRHTNPVTFFDTDNNIIYRQPMQFNKEKYEKRKDSIGNGYYASEILKNTPMDFSAKNRLNLEELNTILTSIIFPEKVAAAMRFNITEEDRNFVLKYMSMFPSESDYPSYDSSFTDGYAKFILYGGEARNVNRNIRIFNKVGDAYGQVIDAAYVTDYDKKIEFMVSAAIYCNRDEILNDDKYDYETIGFPFMKNLGQALYDMEAARKKQYLPELKKY